MKNLEVGGGKTIGYLPIETIKKKGFSFLDVMVELERGSVKTIYFSEEESNIKSGALFVVEYLALSNILKKNAKILLDAGWPIETDAFIEHLISHTAERGTKLFRLIEELYGG